MAGLRNPRQVKLSQEQLEWIVREVVRRLQTAESSSGSEIVTSRLALSERLITTETLRGKLEGVQQVNTPPGAVVTPAVVDMLRDKQITLVRGACPEGAPR